MTDLILLPTLERLHPHDGGGVTAFGLTFSVALGEGDTPGGSLLAKSFLTPWNWGVSPNVFQEIEHVLLSPADASSPPKRVKVECENEPRQRLRNALDDRFEEFLELPGAKTWEWSNRIRERTNIDRETRRWPAFVGEVSLYPYPLPQAIGLSYFVRFEEAVAPFNGSVVAAPVLKLRHEGRDLVLEPDFKPVTGERATIFYKEAPPPPPPAGTPPPNPPPPSSLPSIVVETVVCPVNPPQPTQYFDFKDLWVTATEDDVAPSDWRAGLELRLAEQLNLARTLAEWMTREIREGRQAALAGRYPAIAAIALEQLAAEMLGPGLRPGPEGNLLERARFFRGEAVPAAAAELVRVKAAEWLRTKTKRDRIGWLRQAVTGKPLEAEGVTGAGLLDLAVRGTSSEEMVFFLRGLTLEQTVGELDQVLASTFTPATLRTLFQIQWKTFIAENPNLPAGVLKFARSLAAELPDEVDLQRLLLLDHLGVHWPDFKAAFAGSHKLEAIRRELKAPYKNILVNLAVPGWTPADRDRLAGIFVDRVLPGREQIAGFEPRRTKGLTFQLDTLSTNTSDGDMLTRIQGLAVLMRREGETEWRCLNMAAADLGEENPLRVLLSTRLAYLNDLRSPTVTYDNGPLTAEGPLSPCEISGAAFAEGLPDDIQRCPPAVRGIDEPLVKFRYADGARIPGLFFGKTYEIAPFMVTNSGAIPKALADGNPWKLKRTITSVPVTPIKVTYPRESHVGSLRVQPKNAVALPPIPANVAPRVRGLAPEQVLPAGDPLLGDLERRSPDSLEKTDSLLAKTPLLLLASDFSARPGMKVDNKFSFQVMPPTVDFETWHRWVGLSFSKERRKFICRSFYQLAFDQKDVDVKLENAGVYLDDPAVDGVWFELALLGKGGEPVSLRREKVVFLPKPLKQRTVPILADFSNWRDADCTLETEQRIPIDVTCEVTGDHILVKVGPEQKELPGTGRLFRLSIYASLGPDAEKRFLNGKEIVRRHELLEGTSPWHLLIEIPQKLPGQKEVLQTALREILEPDNDKAKNGRLAVSLDLNRLSEENREALAGLVYRAELWHQVWHWRGRPPAKHPRLEAGSQEDAFEMSEFGVRSDDEHRRLPMPRVPRPADQPEPVFTYEEDLDLEGPRGDRRALHHRFSTRVFSRWEGLLREEDSYLEAVHQTTENRWRPLFVPCRHRGDVPVPKIKMVLPLTQGKGTLEGADTLDESPGLLVVVDGAWYEVGGLAEKLDVEVMDVTGPDDAKTQFLQAGTDPIVTEESAGQALGQSPGALKKADYEVRFEAEGAIGHHRDSSQTDPFFLASSFLLPRPTVLLKSAGQALKDKNLAWWFLKLRFRRKLQVEGEAKPLLSEPSAPFWVQVLPGVERVEEDWFGNGDLEITLKSNHQLSVRRRDGQPLSPNPGKSFYLFGVMTRRVTDFAGRPDQEVYLAVWRQDGEQWQTDATIGSREGLYIRWIEVQGRKLSGIDRGDKLWERIFTPDQPDSDRARIVRISKRFNVTGGTP